MSKGLNGKAATVVITYNSVDGYPAGTYDGPDGPLVIVSNDNKRTWGEDEAPRKLGQLLHELFGRITPEDVGHVYLYVGLYAMEGALRAAEMIAKGGNKLTVVACDCDRETKQVVADRLGAPVIWCECGGKRGLTRIVDSIIREPAAA